MKNRNQKLILFSGIVIIFILGSLFHFVYDFTGKLFVFGLLFPVNESIFEHIKIAVLPIILWWSLWYMLKKNELNVGLWFSCALISALISALLVPMFYYFYTEVFGLEIILVDILILLIAICISQSIAFHYYNYGKGISFKASICLILSLLLFIATLSVFTPKTPFFKDPQTSSYGILEKK